MRSLLSLVVLLVRLLLLSFHVRPLGDLVGLFTVGAGLVRLLLGELQWTLLLGPGIRDGFFLRMILLREERGFWFDA
jgi:hypothetical protein